MSPEQGSGARQLDGRSDIYSLGCVLYEMLSGDPPFTGSSAQAILVRKMTDSVPSLRVVRETVPEALEHAIVRSLAKVPGARFGTAQRFADGLAEALYPPKQETKPARRYGLRFDYRRSVYNDQRSSRSERIASAGVGSSSTSGSSRTLLRNSPRLGRSSSLRTS